MTRKEAAFTSHDYNKQTTRTTTTTLLLRTIDPVLSGVFNFKILLLSLASSGLVATSCLNPVNGIDPALRDALVICKIKPLDSSLSRVARASPRGRIRLVELGDSGHWLVRLGQLVKCKDRRAGVEEMVANYVLKAL